MKKLFIWMIIVAPMSSHAVFQEVYQGYLNSDQNQLFELQKRSSLNDEFYQNHALNWRFSMAPLMTKSFNASLTGSSQDTKATGFQVGLTRPSFEWGTFSVTQKLLNYDLSNWTATGLLAVEDKAMSEGELSLSYEYNIWNQENKLKLQTIALSNEYNKKNIEQMQTEGTLNFFMAYIKAKGQYWSVKLTKEFLTRAKERRNIIRRRVKDGISRKVDLIQADISLLTQKENLEKQRSSLKESLAVIEFLLKREINEEDLISLTWNLYPKKNLPKEEFMSHIEIEVLEKAIEKIDLELKNLDLQNSSTLKIVASYDVSDINKDSSKALSHSLMNSDNTSYSIALNYSIPFGNSKKDYFDKKLFLQKEQNSLKMRQLKDNLSTEKKSLKKRLVNLEEAFKIAEEKIKKATQGTKEFQKLYLTGRSTFDEVIRAEESLISARLARMNILASYDLLLAKYTYLTNTFMGFLKNYMD